MTKIESIWEELEQDLSGTSHNLYRRYSGTVLPDIFITIKNPERQRGIAAYLNRDIVVNLSNYANLKDIGLNVIQDIGAPDRKILIFTLLNPLHKDIFSVLAEDLINEIKDITEEAKLARILLNRFEKWKSLFDRISPRGLSPEACRGLFGELFFIRKLLLKKSRSYYEIIRSWQGPESGIRDFESGDWGVEVKTTHGNNHQKVQISSERQLDTSHVESLYLYHLSLESRVRSGETLIRLVDAVSEILKSDFAALRQFQSKLLYAGLFPAHYPGYEDTGYLIRQETWFKIENDFPRIEEKDIREGVGDVKYSVVLTGCARFAKTEEEIFETINFP